ncbi:hypothetical protein E2542_SST02424 [Spatholobus suberectus]|nr:hypothetical protein E2542_SST02424 [Spatholobus suberectus]
MLEFPSKRFQNSSSSILIFSLLFQSMIGHGLSAAEDKKDEEGKNNFKGDPKPSYKDARENLHSFYRQRKRYFNPRDINDDEGDGKSDFKSPNHIRIQIFSFRSREFWCKRRWFMFWELLNKT